MTTAPPTTSWNSTRFGGVGCPKLSMRTRRIQALVIHCTDGGEALGSARGVCSWWDNPAAAGNAHKVYEKGGIYRYAADDRAAWHASQANQWSLGYEFCGKAGQTREQWLDDLSVGGLRLGAEDMARDCQTYGIEVAWLTDDHLRAIHGGNTQITGITDHATIDRVWAKKSGGHYDPGPNFPTVDLLLAIRGYLQLWGVR